MTTRITNIQQTNNWVDQMYAQRRQIDKIQNEVSSGLKVALPSEDPGRAGTITKFQSTVQRIERHGDRITTAVSILETQESVLDSIQNILIRAREINTQASNGTVPEAVRATLAKEVFQLRDELVGLINTRSQGSYIYGGAADDTPPFQVANAVTGGYVVPGDGTSPESQRYVWVNSDGASSTKAISVTDSDTVKLNTPASIFQNAVSSIERLGRALSGYRTEPAPPALPDGTGTALTFPGDYTEQTTDLLECLDLLEDAQVNDVEIERTDVGARANRLYRARDILELVKLNTEKARSGIQDADIFESSSRLAGMELSLQALLASGSKITELTLLNYI